MKKLISFLILTLFLCSTNTYSQQYKVSVNGYIKSTKKNLECHTCIKMTYYLSSGKTKYEEILMAYNHDEGIPWIFSNNFTSNERITGVKCVGIHADNPTGPKSCYTIDEGSDYQVIQESDYPCVNLRLDNQIIGKYDNGSYIDVKIEPADIQINYHNPVQYGNEESPGINFLHESIPIFITATEGFPRSVYKWEYSIGDIYNWGPLGDEFINDDRTEVTLKATDLLSYEQIMYKTPVYVRINCDCNEFKTSNRIDLQPKIAAPVFKKVVTKKDENCPGNADGEVIVELNRPLFQGETIEILGRDDESGLFFSLSQEMIGGNQCRIYNLSPGTFTFQLKGSYIDHHGDKISTGIIVGSDEYSFSESIGSGNPPIFELLDFGNPGCWNGNNGWITVKGEGGSGEYKLICENQSKELFESNFYYSEITINTIPVGKYNIWVTDSKGCISNMYPERIAIENPKNPIEIDKISIFNPIEGENTGSISVSVKNGTAPYSAIWREENESGNILDSGVQPGGNLNQISTIQNLRAGNYHILITDANGCQIAESITLEAFPVFDITTTQTTEIQCHGDYGGELSATVVGGGSGIYSKYEWYKIDQYLGYNPIGTNSSVLSEIEGGQYRMKVTDNNGRQSWSDIITVDQPDPIEATFSTSTLKCRGDADGQITASISGGAGNYTWKWNNGESGSDNTTILDKLSAGTYTLSIEDKNGCKASFDEEVKEPAPLSISEGITPPSCYGMKNASISIFISGGNPDYSIHWSQGSTSSHLLDLPAGKYTVNVTDKFGCETLEKEFTIPDPTPVTAVVTNLINVSRNGQQDGSVSVSIEGGTAPYRATCKDDKNNWHTVPGVVYPSDKPAYLEIKNLPEGNYTLFIQDLYYKGSPDNKYSSCSYNLEFSISEPPPLIINIDEAHHVSCNGGNDGSLTVHAQGGSPFETGEPYQYKWYRQQGSSRIFIEESTNKTILDNLRPGIYLAEVIDRNNTSTFSTPYILINPAAIKMQFKTAVLTCASDSTGWVEAKVTGGQGSFSYEWSTGEIGISRIEKKPGGWYSLSVRDERGCNVIDSTFISSPKSIQIDYKLSAPLCDGHGDAYISMIISGGEAPYSYRWSNGDSTAYLDNVYPGKYTVRITDDLKCYKDTTFIVPEASPVKAKLEEIVSPLAFGHSDGSIRVSISGGTLPYSISWKNDQGEFIQSKNTEENGIISSVIESIPEGNYHLFIEDNNYQKIEIPSSSSSCGCLFYQSFYVSQPPKLELKLENTQIIRCFGTNDGSLSAHAKGGVPRDNSLPYSYEWHKDGEIIRGNDSIISKLGEGNYFVRITDANGISIESEHVILKEPEILSMTTSVSNLKCSKDTNGWAQAEVSGGTAPYTFNWSNGANSPRIENVPRGKYFVYVTDANVCEITATANIAQLNGINANAILTPPTCHNGSNGSIQLDISGGEAPYSYKWENGEETLIRSGLRAGNYNITITDANNCSQETFSYELSHPDSIIISLGKDITLCEGQSKLIKAESNEMITNYGWFDQSGTKLSEKSDIILSDSGIYRIEITTTKGCRGAGSINVNRDNRKIANDFLIASLVPINDEVLVINISNLAPDKIEWILPEGEGSLFEVIDKSEDILNIIFKQYGNFSIGMTSYSKNCTETTYKMIQVMNKENISDYEDADEPILKSFAVYPNPNPGYFEATIEIKEDTPVVLLLVNSGSGKVIERRTLKGKKVHTETFNITGNEKGTYILNLYSSKIRSAKKVILK